MLVQKYAAREAFCWLVIPGKAATTDVLRRGISSEEISDMWLLLGRIRKRLIICFFVVIFLTMCNVGSLLSVVSLGICQGHWLVCLGREIEALFSIMEDFTFCHTLVSVERKKWKGFQGSFSVCWGYSALGGGACCKVGKYGGFWQLKGWWGLSYLGGHSF